MGGNLVLVEGTNFLMPTVVPSLVGSTPLPDASMRLTVGDIVLDWSDLRPISDTRLLFVVPRVSMLDANGVPLVDDTLDVDITLENLDAAGDLIPGELVTAEDAYRYLRTDLSHQNPTDMFLLTMELCRRLTSIIGNVMHTPHPDYDADPNSVFIDTDRLPALSIMGPTMDRDYVYEENADCEVEEWPDPGETLVQRGPRAYTLTYDIVGITDDVGLTLNLMETFAHWMARNTVVTWVGVGGHTNEVPLDFEDGGYPAFATGGQANANSGVSTFTTTIVVSGFQGRQLPGIAADNATGLTAPIAEDGIELQSLSNMTDNSLVSPAPGSPDV